MRTGSNHTHKQQQISLEMLLIQHIQHIQHIQMNCGEMLLYDRDGLSSESDDSKQPGS